MKFLATYRKSLLSILTIASLLPTSFLTPLSYAMESNSSYSAAIEHPHNFPNQEEMAQLTKRGVLVHLTGVLPKEAKSLQAPVFT